VAVNRRRRSASTSSPDGAVVDAAELQHLLEALKAANEGGTGIRLSTRKAGIVGELGRAFNELADTRERTTKELVRVSSVVGRDGRLSERARINGASGTWATSLETLNALIDNLSRPTREVGRVLDAVAEGDLSRKMELEIDGQPVKGEFARIGSTVNAMVDQLSAFADEVTRVAREVGTDGKLGGQAKVKGVSGVWKDLTDSVNQMASNLTAQVRNIAEVTTAVANGDLSKQVTVDVKGEVLELKNTVNTMVGQLAIFADEVTRVAREVGDEGILGGQAQVKGVSGVWRDLTENVNTLAGNLTSQVRNIANVTTAVANGDLSRKITVDVKGEVLELKETINTMVDQLRSFSSEVTRVAREVGTEGQLGGQAQVEDVSGVWRDLTENVNTLAGNLTSQVRNIADVTTAVANGDLSRKITVAAAGEVAELKDTVNTMVDQLATFADEVTRVAREVGTEGRLGGQARVRGVSGVWEDLTENVNTLAGNLTSQVRNIAEVTTAVANGDLSRKITVAVSGEVLELKETVNTMVDQLRSFAAEVTRVAREVGTEGQLGGQAEVEDVSGVWRDLTESVNFMASNLTSQVRNIAEVTTAVAQGDLGKKITVDVKGEIAELKDTINTMVDQLGTFADEVTRVAREVGTEGQLGGQAQVEDVSGVWRDLTENVNFMAASLTTQVRAIADVSTAVTKGDLTRSIAVDARGEVSELKDNINQMISTLRDTTQQNAEQDWLNSNLARFGGLMQGQRDLKAVSRLIMSQLTPLVSAQHGAFFVAEEDDGRTQLRLLATYGYKERKTVSNRFKLGEALVGQAALEKQPILVTDPPDDYVRITSALGEATPRNIIVIPALFEDNVMAVVELASFQPFTQVQLALLEQLAETIGVVLNTIQANMRTEELLTQSQSLAQELQSQSEELQTQQEELQQRNEELEETAATLRTSEELLQTQQEELQQTNEELEEKARQLGEQNARIEIKNQEIELARAALEEKAEQLALSSKYKSEFLANMSHELRTPLNSLLILAKLLADNTDGNLTDKQIEFSSSIHAAGTDLLELINDILDLSKVEAGKMELATIEVPLGDLRERIERAFAPVAEQKRLELEVAVSGANVPPVITTDLQRLEQVLRNLLSNAFKFTDEGRVTVSIGEAPTGDRYLSERLNHADRIVEFAVSDTGIGIPPDKLRLIFEAFQQADGTTNRRYGGTGLGLSISREIASLLGGEIHVESKLGEGSTFTFYLPVTYAAPVERPHLPATDDGQPAEPGEVFDSTLLLRGEVPDDRGELLDSDRSVLIVEQDADFARTVQDVARERGFKTLVALRGDTGLALAHEFKPDGIVLDLNLPVIDGGELLERLKRNPATRHIPVHIVSGGGGRQQALRAGAVAFLEKPVTREGLDEAFASITSFIDREARNLLVVEDDDDQRKAIVELVGVGDDVNVVAVGSSEEALAALAETRFDCMVLDLKLPGKGGFALLEQVKKSDAHRDVPVIVYTGKDLTRQEETRLRKYAETIIVKDVRSPERLLDETALFLHRVESHLPAERRRVLEQLHSADAVFQGRKILIVDDDVRNVFALASVLEGYGMEVLYGENGQEGLTKLEEHPDVDLVLMDIMMPELDGYETTRAVREQQRFEKLPIIALTAKAMTGDREKSIESGASDYIAKPVDTDQLLSLMRVWLYQ
jgi:CheY-like chemotaxis protein/signal transduction histidine kinase/HAMP domain-containing protein